jgi:hypothetical protein
MKSYLAGVCLALAVASAALAQQAAKKSSSTPTPASSPTTPNVGTAKQSTTSNVGGIWYTQQRIKFASNMYVWVFCVMADGKEAMGIEQVMSGVSGTALAAVTGGASAIAQTLLKTISATTLESVFTPIVDAIALKPGYTYCYHVKFADDKSLTPVYPVRDFATSAAATPFTTNSYLKRYTASGVSSGTFVVNDASHKLKLEYPNCTPASCPCRGQYCGIYNFSMLDTQTDDNDPVVMASVCIEYPASSPKSSFIMSVGDPTKITDPKNQPTPTDVNFAPDNFSLLVPVSQSCEQRKFTPGN